MQVWNVLHAARWKYRTQKWCKKLQSAHHRTTLSGYIFATKARIDNRKKLVKQQYLSHMSYSIVNFGPLAAEIVSLVWGTLVNFNGFCILAALLHSHTAALNSWCHLYLAGRPSRWALAEISSYRWSRVVCRSVCHSSAACKTVEPIEMPFGLRTLVGLWNNVLDGGPDPPCTKAILRERDGPLWSIGTFCRELRKNGWTDRDVVWSTDLGVSEEACVNWEHIGATWWIWLNCPCMQSLCQITLTTC